MECNQYDQFDESARVATAAFADCGELLGAAPPSVLYHYTTPAGLLGIVDDGAIFLSDAAFLNDSSEIIYARALVSGVLHDHAVAEADPMKAFMLELASHSLQIEDGATSRFRYYVASFCEAPDLLSQWRAYGNPGSGYAIGFQSIGLIAAGGRFDPLKKVKLRKVVYDETEQRCVVDRIVAHWAAGLPSDGLDEDGAADCSGALLLAVAYILPQLKHPMFREEREWRLLVRLFGGAEPGRIWFRQSGAGIMAYTRLDLRITHGESRGKLPLREIAHAPANDSTFRKDAVRELLRSKGYPEEEVRVCGSTIPLRLA
jgi:hypothetical protein